MPTSYTSLLGLALPVTGELSGTWGDTVNNYITQYLDSSVAGTQTISGSQTAVTLTTTTNASLSQVGSGATGSAQYNIINCTGNPAATLVIDAPKASKTYVVNNATSTNQSVTLRGGPTTPTTGVTLVAGEKAVVAWNGSDFIKVATSTADGVTTIGFGTTGLTPSAATSGAVTVAGTLVAANGGTGQSSYTTGDLLYATGSTALSKLGIGTNGQVLTSTGTAPQWSTLSGVAVTTFSAGTTGFTPSSATSGAVTLAGTLATTNGGTGLTSFTANRVFYSSSTSAIGSSANLTFDGTTLTANALTTTSTVTINGGTANGVAYLNGSKVLTTGGTLTFDGTTLRTGTSSTTSPGVKINMDGGGTQTYFALTSDPLTIFSISRPSGSNNLRFDANYGGFVWGIGSAGTATEAMALTSTGLGIGTSSPSTKLTIAQSSNVITQGLLLVNAAGTQNGGWYHGGSALIGREGGIDTIALAAGNVGIGTSSPGQKLEVNGSAYLGGRGSTFALMTPDWRMYNSSSGNALVWDNYSTEMMRLSSAGNLGLGVTPSGAMSRLASLASSSGAFSALANGAGTGDGTLTTTAMRVLNNIGTTWQIGRYEAYAHVWGVGGSASASSAMTFDANGYLGVGTTNPAFKLVVSNGGAQGLELDPTAVASGALIQAYNRSGSAYTQLTYDSLLHVFRTSGTERVRIDSSGNLLVGTSSANYSSAGRGLLEVNGSSNSLIGLKRNNAASAYLYAVSSEFQVVNVENTPITFYTNSAERARIDSNGNLLVGGTAARGTTVGSAALQLFNGTAPAGTLTNGVSLYSSSGDLRFMDAAGNAYQVGFRNVPQSGAAKTGSYTLATGDVGEFILINSGGSIVVPTSTFSAGDVVSLFNNTTGNITITCSAPTAYIAGANTVVTSVTLATRGVATVLFITATLCVITGNVS